MKRTALMLHSQLLYPEVWESVMVGDALNGILGVYSKGIALAESEDVGIVILGAGLSHRDDCPRLVESKKYIRTRIKEIITGFRPGVEVILDEDSQDTRQEVWKVAKILSPRPYIQRVVSVTAPKHAPRALRDFLACQDKGAFPDMEIVSIPSMVDFPNAAPEEVVILEPFHRPDLQSYPIHQYGAAMVKVMKGDPARAERFFEGLGRLLESHGL